MTDVFFCAFTSLRFYVSNLVVDLSTAFVFPTITLLSCTHAVQRDHILIFFSHLKKISRNSDFFVPSDEKLRERKRARHDPPDTCLLL